MILCSDPASSSHQFLRAIHRDNSSRSWISVEFMGPQQPNGETWPKGEMALSTGCWFHIHINYDRLLIQHLGWYCLNSSSLNTFENCWYSVGTITLLGFFFFNLYN